MATITAKFTSGSIYNVLDPNTWVGGVVPGQNDIAVLPQQSLRTTFNQTTATNFVPYTPWTGNRDILVTSTVGFPKSGSFYCFPALFRDALLPIKIDYQTTASSTTFVSCSIDHTYREWRYENSHSYTEAFPGDNPVAIGDLRLGDYLYSGYSGSIATTNPFNWQNRYELTGSDVWNVARVEMGHGTDFTIKDTATINLFSTGSTNYAAIQSMNSPMYGGVRMLDRCALYTTGSVMTATGSAYSGINMSNTYAYLIISGAANYSSSLLASSSAAGTSTITLTSPQSFGAGDYITIQSTPNMKRVANVKSGSDASKLNGILPRYVDANLYMDYRYPSGSSYGAAYFSVYDSASYETDDVVQIESISGSVATISKRYGKQGDVQQDLGLMNYQTFTQTYGGEVNYFPGTRRVALIDSQHLNYQADETVIISGSAYKVIYAGSYLSQSKFIDFTDTSSNDWRQYVALDPYMYSGSGYNMSAATWNPSYRKYTLLTTASRAGKAALYLNSASLSTPATPLANEFQAYIPLKNTYFKEGEIEISGSIIRDFTNTASANIDGYLSVFAGEPPSNRIWNISSLAAVPGAAMYSVATGLQVNNANIQVRTRTGNATNHSFSNRIHWPQSASFDVHAIDNDLQITPFTGSNQSFTAKMELNNGVRKSYLQGVLVDEHLDPAHPRGMVAVHIQKYASLFSIRIKDRYQIVILDTQNVVNYGDRVKQGGLIDTQTAGKTCKFIANEIEDPMGFKNLTWDYYYKKGNTNLLPYMHNQIYLTSGSVQDGATNATVPFSSHCALGLQYAATRVYNSIPMYGKTGPDYYATYDLGTGSQFDTVGVGFSNASVGYESVVNQVISGSRIDVADDPDNWTTVWSRQNDTRLSTGANAIRFYTFPSGSVNKRFIRFYSNGLSGSANADINKHGFFGVYSFATASNGAYGATNTTNQIKLRSAQNFAVGDKIMFWNKDSAGTRSDYFNQDTGPSSYVGLQYDTITGIHTGAVTDSSVAGGLTTYYTITAISGSVITLDRAPAYDHLFVGTVVMKVNRGGINFDGTTRHRSIIVMQSDNGNFHVEHLNQYNANGASTGYGIYRVHTAAGFWCIRCNLEDVFTYSPIRYTAKPVILGNYARMRNVVAMGRTSQPPGVPEHIHINKSAVGFNIYAAEGFNNWYYPISRIDKLTLNHIVENLVPRTAASIINGAGTTPTAGTRMSDPSTRRGRWYVKNNYFYTSQNDPRAINILQFQDLASQVSKQLIWGENYIAGPIISSYTGASFSLYPDLFMKCVLIDYRNYNSNQPSENRKQTTNNYFYNIPGSYTAGNLYFQKLQVGMLDNLRIRLDRPNSIRLAANLSNASLIFDEGTYYSVWTDVPHTNTINDYGNFLTAGFYVNSDADVRVQLDMQARVNVSRKHGISQNHGTANYIAQGYDYYGAVLPKILVVDLNNNTVIFSKMITSSNWQDASINQTFSLKQGDYAVTFEPGWMNSTLTYGWTFPHMFDYTEPNLRIATANKNNIDVIHNNWDITNLFRNRTNNIVSDIYLKDNIGAETVARTSTNLTTTTRFNGVKL